jgi:hypothetical protein
MVEKCCYDILEINFVGVVDIMVAPFFKPYCYLLEP